MAPLFQYLCCCLFLSTLFVSSFSVFASSKTETQLPQILTTQNLLGRRILLAKAVEDDEEDLTVVLPKKKKVQKANVDDKEGLSMPKKKKKKLSVSSNEDGGDELAIKKKKLTSLDDEEETISKKKKSSDDDDEEEILLPKKKKSSSSSSEIDTKVIKPKTTSSKNQTKLIKPGTNLSSSSKNQTKLIKPITSSGSSKNKTKLTKPTSSKSKEIDDDSKPNLSKTKIKKSNSTSKPLDSTKKSTLDLLKTISSSGAKHNKTKSETKKQVSQLSKSKNIKQESTDKSGSSGTKKQKAPPSPSSWLYEDEDNDLIPEFRDLPTKFQQTFVPDLQRISTTSRVYLSKASKEITKGFKPYVGNKYAASVATAISFAFIVVPLLLVSLLFNRIKAYFSLQKLLIFIQIYLAIYFSILCVSSLITGLEPLRFFYATSWFTYVWLQLLQTLGYALFLLLLLMYLVLVFSTESGLAHKLLGLAQTFVGFAVGLHYYMTVFHRVVLRQPPKTNWKVHGIYAACFLVICLLARADKRKKAYLEEGGQEGKQN